jgi:hypothetical protein
MVKRTIPLAVGAVAVALVVGGIAFATDSPLLGGADQTATTSTQSDPATPLQGNAGRGSASCSDATAHALEVLLARQATGANVGGSIAAVQACGTGVDSSEGSGEVGPPDWVPGPPPWAGAESGNGSSEGAITAGPPASIVTESPPHGGADQAASTSTQSDSATPPDGNPGQGAAHCAVSTAHALEAKLSRQAAGGQVGNSITAIQACGTGANGASESEKTGGPPEWVPGPPPWADNEAPE